MSHRRPYRPHRHEFRVCRFRRESIWQRIRRSVHEASPRIDLGNWP